MKTDTKELRTPNGEGVIDMHSKLPGHVNTHTLTGLLQLPKNSGSEMGSIKKERAMLARRPFGASLVIFTPFWSTATGKVGDG